MLSMNSSNPPLTCVQGHHAWVTHHSKGGHHTYWEFVCDKEVLNSDVNKCNCK